MPRAVDVDGNTLLHAACARGALRAAKLVARWAVYSAHPPDRNFLNLQSGDGMTALDLARQGGFRKTEEWLVALGALGRGGTGPGSLAGADGGGGFSRRVVPGEYPRHHYLSGDAHPSHRVVAGPPAHHHPYAGMPFPGGVLPGYPHPQHPHALPYGYPGGPVPAAVSLVSAGGVGARGGGDDDFGDLLGGATSATKGDSYLMGALEAALGGEAGGHGQRAEDRRRAQEVVRKVAEALEDRDDMAEELEEAEAARDAALARAEKAEKALAEARAEARAEVATQREEEQAAVLSALGLAEERAVQMAAECETLREERDAIASALDYVNDECEAAKKRADDAEADADERREEDYRAGYAAGLMAARSNANGDAVDSNGDAIDATPSNPGAARASAAYLRDAFERVSAAASRESRDPASRADRGGAPGVFSRQTAAPPSPAPSLFSVAATPVPVSTRASELTPAGAVPSRFARERERSPAGGEGSLPASPVAGMVAAAAEGAPPGSAREGGGGGGGDGGVGLADQLGGLQLLEVPLGDDA